MIRADYHMHTHHSGDSDADMSEMLNRCRSLGFDRFCFTEHYDPDYVYTDQMEFGMFELDIDSYYKEYIEIAAKHSDIRAGFGVELGVQPHLIDQLTGFVDSKPLDFVIASSHLCYRKDPYYPEFFEGRNVTDTYNEYFQSIEEITRKFDHFDVYGHLDYVVRYSPEKDLHYKVSNHLDYIDSILTRLIQNGKGIEINTGGLRHGLRSTNPCEDILKRYKELGGEIITVGSDAHKPEDIGALFDEAEQILLRSGFRFYTTFSDRRPEFHKLG